MQNWALCSLPNPMLVLGGVKEMCAHVSKMEAPRHKYPGHLGKQEAEKLVVRSAHFFLDNIGIERSFMWQAELKKKKIVNWGEYSAKEN